ncbi:type II toxin-antitoxin system HicB family antitoxin [Gudongella sp. DL1XJH-153]|uniref:type II toxin-antitoxin system HicB family antitoxin n=1 Tax=Gudongella sp. DL1XJH-153 TaxID=3409804 RepID=UPI003BB7126F
MKNRYIYPAIIRVDEDAYDVSFPDIDNCFTFGETLEDSLDSARDVLELCLYDMEKDGKEIPKASGIGEISLDKNETIAWINVWMIPVRDKMENKAVKKTLTIPKWLNDVGIENNLNFSSLLQSAIKEKVGIYDTNSRKQG